MIGWPLKGYMVVLGASRVGGLLVGFREKGLKQP